MSSFSLEPNKQTHKQPLLKKRWEPGKGRHAQPSSLLGWPLVCLPGIECSKALFKNARALSRLGPLAHHSGVWERDEELRKDKVALDPVLARESHSLPDLAPVARTSHRRRSARVRSLPGPGPAWDCCLNPHLAQARSGDSSWKPGLSPLPDGRRPAAGPPGQQAALNPEMTHSFLYSGHRGRPEPRAIAGPTLHTRCPGWGGSGGGLCGIALRARSREGATEI